MGISEIAGFLAAAMAVVPLIILLAGQNRRLARLRGAGEDVWQQEFDHWVEVNFPSGSPSIESVAEKLRATQRGLLVAIAVQEVSVLAFGAVLAPLILLVGPLPILIAGLGLLLASGLLVLALGVRSYREGSLRSKAFLVIAQPDSRQSIADT